MIIVKRKLKERKRRLVGTWKMGRIYSRRIVDKNAVRELTKILVEEIQHERND
jgi:hypothetical protein